MGIGRVIGKVGGSFLEGTGRLGHALQDGVMTVAAGASQVTARPLRKVGTGLAKKTLVKKTEKTFANGYTGYESSKFLNHAAGWGTLGVAGAIGVASGAGPAVGFDGKIPGLDGIVQTRASKVGTVSYGGSPSIMDADGVGSSTQAPSLGASGDLVFGLHNGRRG